MNKIQLTEENSLLKIDAKDFSIANERMEEIKKPFYPLADQYLLFLPSIEKIKEESKNGVTLDLVEKAKKLKKDIAKIRTKTGEVKDEEKKGVLQIGNAIQKCHNIIINVIEEQEKELEKIVKYFEIQEKERVEKLQKERGALLFPFITDETDLLNLGEMEEDLFNAFLLGKQTAFKQKKEIEAKLEAERIEKERLEKEEEIRKIKEQARIEAEEKSKREKEEMERKQKEELERIEREKQQAIERLKKEQEQKELAEKKRKEDEEQARIEAEKKEKEEKELAEKRKEFIKYRDSIVFDHYEDKDGMRIFYKKVGEFKIK